MKKVKLCFIILLVSNISYSFVYDPGDLLNSVKRSQLITDIFSDRFNVIRRDLDQAKSVDIFLNGENIPGFKVITPFGVQDLTLFRVFGSVIIKFEEINDFGIFKWGLGFGIAGYRYGMYKSIDLYPNSTVNDGGVEDKTFIVKDYIYSQIFDDLIVITNILKPFGYIHLGIVMNKEVLPGIDGIIGTNDDTQVSSKSRFFIDSNLFGFLLGTFGYNSDTNKSEFITFKIDPIGFFNFTSYSSNFSDRVKYEYLFIGILLGYSYTNPSIKYLGYEDKIHTGIVETFVNLSGILHLKTYLEFFLSEKKENELIRQAFIEGMFDIMGNKEDDFSLYLILGISRFSSNRLKLFEANTSSTVGWIFGIKMVLFSFKNFEGNAEINMSKNYSEKLLYLVEAYNHYIFQLKLNIRF